MGYAELVGRSLLALVFLVAVVGKLRGGAAFAEFAGSVAQFGLLPAGWVMPAARVAVGVEALVVVLLPLPATAPAGYLVATGLLGVLTGAMLAAVRRGRRPVCRCFGAGGAAIGARHVVRNALLAAVAVAGLALSLAATGPSPRPAGGLLAVAAAVPLAAVVVRLDDLVDLFVAHPPTPRPANSAADH